MGGRETENEQQHTSNRAEMQAVVCDGRMWVGGGEGQKGGADGGCNADEAQKAKADHSPIRPR